jgi:hypothetical protein
MSEKINVIIQKDENEPVVNKNTEEGFEITKTLELTKFADDISKINEAINHDRKINLSDVENIEKTIGQIKVNIGGEEMTIEEAKKIPKLKENIKIWKEIREGSFDNIRNLTFLIPEIAEYLSKYKGILWLNGLSSISDTATEHLSKHEGPIQLNGLIVISDTVAKYLSKNNGKIWLNGLTSISDTAAEHLSEHEGDLFLDSLTSISDTVAEHLSKHNGEISLGGLASISDTAAEHLSHKKNIYLFGLTSISDIAAEHFSKGPNLLYTNKIIQEKIDKYKK